ncbi:MAG: DUF167 domain-containing protein [Promethearchaeota archaeon]
MNFFKKLTDFVFLLKINVKTNAKIQNITKVNDFLKISLKSKPMQNKANKELINLIKRKLKITSTQIQIISGLKNPDKIIKITFLEKINEEELVRQLIDTN